MIHQRIAPVSRPPAAPDARWRLLDLVREARADLGLRDRDLAVLRGLLTLVPPGARPDQRIVFASNRVLSERCDGIEERTLRRRLVHLEAQGLVRRRLSPNGKRYQIEGAVTYGIDLTPLWTLEAELVARAKDVAQRAGECRRLKALIRDRLYHLGVVKGHEDARRALRRKLSPEALQAVLETLPPTDLSASDSQSDRHIQKSEEESLNEGAEKPDDLTVQDCLDLVPTARGFAQGPTGSWSDVIRLAESLGPAIGVAPRLQEAARRTLGAHGSALAILGLVEAWGRIRRPEAYLHRLIQKAAEGGLDPVRMFRSLVTPARAPCISG